MGNPCMNDLLSIVIIYLEDSILNFNWTENVFLLIYIRTSE